ncbi:hypothetical protein DL765_002473 [Monosporascus sp. GIB2]|nr:hypothetical protein DL765_002473 [Monosporascus sp. GIB2]
MRFSAAVIAPLLGRATADLLFNRPVKDNFFNAKSQVRGLFMAAPPRQTGSIHASRRNERAARRSGEKTPRDVAVEQRQSNIQIPFVFCPEEFGAPLKTCDECGGDSYEHGKCNDLLLSGRQWDQRCFTSGDFCSGYYCECTHEGKPHNPQVTSTAVVDGQTGTVIYEPLTLTEYAKLRASTTVTVTGSPTATSSGDSSLETMLAVVFAGGLTWLAVSESGGAAAIAAIRPPNKKPEDAKDDDKSCEPEPECKDCGGSDGVGLCSSGDKTGCPCEEKQNCPNEPPKCSDQKCGGDNGQSQCAGEGETKGCLCCPDEIPDCNDKQCDGSLSLLCTAPKWEKCGCELGAGGEISRPGDRPDPPGDPAARAASITSVAKYVYTTIWHADPRSVPGWTEKTTSMENCTYVTPTPTGTTTEDCYWSKRLGVRYKSDLLWLGSENNLPAATTFISPAATTFISASSPTAPPLQDSVARVD